MPRVHDDARSIPIIPLQAIDDDIVLVACKRRPLCNGWAGTGKAMTEKNSEKDGSNEKCASKLEAPRCLYQGVSSNHQVFLQCLLTLNSRERLFLLLALLSRCHSEPFVG